MQMILYLCLTHRRVFNDTWMPWMIFAHRRRWVNLGKTKIMIFHTSRRVMQDAEITFQDNRVEVVTSYAYLGVTFTSIDTCFSMRRAFLDRLTRGYVLCPIGHA